MGDQFYLFNVNVSVIIIMVRTGISQTGWMTSTTFLEYMQKIFYPFLLERGVEFPVVVFVDGHSSHFSFDISEFCAEK